MRERNYLDFDLLVEGVGEGTYRARVINAPTGETLPVGFAVPFSELEVENFLLKIGRPRRQPVRGLGSPEAAAIKQFGGALFDAVFGGELRIALATSIDRAEQQEAGLRLRLRLTDCPELADLPWEYLYDPRTHGFLALSEWTPLVRYLELPGRVRPLAVRPPLRVLVLVAAPSDYPELDVEAEWEKLRDALQDLEDAGRVQVERLPAGTLADLQKQLWRGDYHVFHYIGHGGYDPAAGDGVLVLEDARGRGQHVSGEDIGSLLHDHRTLRLAVLNSCEGARGGWTDPYSGTAQSLVRRGVPAVVAMQFEITDEAAITFGHTLYEAVADGFPLDAAVAAARTAVRHQPNPVEWGTPVLYLRAPDGRVFDLTPAEPPEEEREEETEEEPPEAEPQQEEPQKEPTPKLELSATVVDLGTIALDSPSSQRTVEIRNVGGGVLNARVTTQEHWLHATHSADEIRVSIDPAVPRIHDGLIIVDSDGGSATIQVLAKVVAPGPDDGHDEPGLLSRLLSRSDVRVTAGLVVLAVIAVTAYALLDTGPRLDDEQMVLSVQGSIVAVDVETGDSQELATGILATISHDRGSIVYLGPPNEAGLRAPRIMDADGGDDHPLFGAGSPCDFSTRPAWNEADDALAVVCKDENDDWAGLHVVGLDGQGNRIDTEGTPVGAPSWVGNDRILFARTTGEDPTRSLWSTDLEGAAEQLTSPVVSFDNNPDWASNGTVLFQRTTPADGHEAWTISLGDAEPKQVGRATDIESPTWSPDGDRIAYLSKPDGETLWVMDADGGNQHKVPGVPGSVIGPAWGSR